MAKTDKVCFVYCHTNKTNGKVYVGISTNPKRRWGSNGCGYKKGHPYFYSAIKKYGWNGFEHKILCKCSFEEAKRLEQFYIKEFNSKSPNGYNLTDGGEGILGLKFSDKTRKKLSESLKGRVSPRKGCKVTEEQRKRMSEAHKGIKWSDERRKNFSLQRTGTKMSEEAKHNLSVARKGMKFSEQHIQNLIKSHIGKQPPEGALEATRKEVCMFSRDGDYITSFNSISDASLYVSGKIGNVSSISRVCDGERKTALGYKWEWSNIWEK